MITRMIVIFLLISAKICIGQSADTINQTDSKGQKQGYWEKKYPNGNPIYQGYFKDNHPADTMKRFYESGEVKVLLHFSDDGIKSKAKFFWIDGSLAADGNYINNKKDSIWNYYSFYDNVIKLKENYKEGIKQGKSFVYYTSGQVFDETNWVNGQKQGEWIQYHPNGNIKLITYYDHGVLSGCFNVFFKTGEPEIVGHYENNLMHGTWINFNEKGEEILTVEYDHGRALNQDVLDEKEKEFFKKMEENVGKIKEPKVDDFVGKN